jgi:hypothetical protein
VPGGTPRGRGTVTVYEFAESFLSRVYVVLCAWCLWAAALITAFDPHQLQLISTPAAVDQRALFNPSVFTLSLSVRCWMPSGSCVSRSRLFPVLSVVRSS